MRLPIGIVGYGTGNITSLAMALEAVGAEVALVNRVEDLSSKAALILPGVGHFRTASSALHESGLAQALYERLDAGLPVLGICLGFQLLTCSSDEAPGSTGLGLLPGSTHHLRPLCTRVYKVPHIGWNSLESSGANSQLLHGIPPEKRCFFFSNAYAIAPNYHQLAIQATYTHEIPWLGLLEHGSIYGVQFHPEKSREQGLHLLRNFLKIAEERT